MNPCVIVYDTKKLSKKQAMLFYRRKGFMNIDYFYYDHEKWILYGGAGFDCSIKSRLTSMPVCINSTLKHIRARHVKRYYKLSEVKEFTKNAKTDGMYYWDKD